MDEFPARSCPSLPAHGSGIGRASPVVALLLVGAVRLAGLAAAAPYSHGDPTDLEQYQLELINKARADPAAEATRLGIALNQGLAAGRISEEAKAPLAFHPLLLVAARGHSDWMLSSGVFNHTGSGGSSPSDRAAAAGYTYGAAENIGYQATSGTPDYGAFTEGIHDGLFLSPGHRTNLMEPSSTVVGLGIRPGTFGALNALMITQNFSAGGASVDSGPFLTGVVYEDANGNGSYDPGEGLSGVRVEPDLGGYHAVSSSSGGYAVPLPPVETVTDVVNLPFAVDGSTLWDDVRPHEESYRAAKINAAALVPVRITWSGGAVGAATETLLTVRRPVRVNYQLRGTNGGFYSRTMVTSPNVKADFDLLSPPAPAPPPVPDIVIRQSARRVLVSGGRPGNLGTARSGPGHRPRRQTFTILNRGGSSLELHSLANTGLHRRDFKVAGFRPATLAPGASATFTVTFRPGLPGRRQTTLSVRSNDPDQPSFRIRLRGRGLP